MATRRIDNVLARKDIRRRKKSGGLLFCADRSGTQNANHRVGASLLDCYERLSLNVKESVKGL